MGDFGNYSEISFAEKLAYFDNLAGCKAYWCANKTKE
jgi:hypothetical protein